MLIPSIILIIFIVAVIIWTIASYVVNRADQPGFTILSKHKDYEVRRYEPYIVAETIVEGEYRQAMNQGFRILAKYIFGSNVSKTKLAMNAPVVEKPIEQSEKLAMTAPVIVRDNSGYSHVISFVMPKNKTLETLPKPIDSRIVLNTVPAHAVAVKKFSWYATDARIAKKKAELRAALESDGVISQGNISYAGYTAPFTIPFLEKHEVMVIIQR
jgi:hypothetical protein